MHVTQSDADRGCLKSVEMGLLQRLFPARTRWALIAVADEDSRSGKDVAAVLRDYRNYVHPEKQRWLGVTLNACDSSMFWEVTKSLAQQLLT
jgi:hypothetical protein